MKISTIITSLLLLSGIALSQSIGISTAFNNNSIELSYHQRIANVGGFLSAYQSNNTNSIKLGIGLPSYNIFQFVIGLQYSETTQSVYVNESYNCHYSEDWEPHWGPWYPEMGPMEICYNRFSIDNTSYTTSLFLGTIIDINNSILGSDNLYFTYNLNAGSSTVGLSWDIN